MKDLKDCTGRWLPDRGAASDLPREIIPDTHDFKDQRIILQIASLEKVSIQAFHVSTSKFALPLA